MTPGRRKPPSRTAPEPTNPDKRKALPIMTQTATAAQQPCTTCNGTRQVQVEIFNTPTNKWITITQACPDCR